ncbi:hypothetical protein [Aquimarina celericrescens]|uniref:Uncharacterized protein n=1 Tax=Aquimarina celericrescens TaxID=1964542 RepID=A0ABW5AYF4_9FLAO|nr:hypothetical protein [Aquimarina celericrescens]
MKNSLNHIAFILIAFLMIGCQKDELPNIEQNLITNAKSWYENNHSALLNQNALFYGAPDWNKVIKVDNDLYFPLTKTFAISSNQRNNSKISRFVKSFLVLSEVDSGYEESLKVYMNKDSDVFDSFEETKQNAFVEFDSGNVKIASSLGQSNKSAIPDWINNMGVTLEKGRSCTSYSVIKTLYYGNQVIGVQVLYSYQVCTGGGGSQGGGSQGGDGLGGGDGGDGGVLPENDPTVDQYTPIETPDSPPSADEQDPESEWEYIPSQITLPDGRQVTIHFGTSADGVSANQKVQKKVIEAIKTVLYEANKNLAVYEKITAIYIKCSTNGVHSDTSNHKRGEAIDLSRINGVNVKTLGAFNQQVIRLQEAWDQLPNVRENFGPHFKHKYDNVSDTWNYTNTTVPKHDDHLHLTVR